MGVAAGQLVVVGVVVVVACEGVAAVVVVVAAQYSAVVEPVAAGTVLCLSLGRSYPYAAAHAVTRHNRVNQLPPMVPLMLPVVLGETALPEMEVMELWMVIAVASTVQGVVEARLASHLELVPSPYRHWKYSRSLSF